MCASQVHDQTLFRPFKKEIFRLILYTAKGREDGCLASLTLDQLYIPLCIFYPLSSCSDQVEKHHPDGRREIIFPDKSVKYIYPSGEEMSIFADGAVERLSTDGSRTIEFPNGQKEIHTKGHKVSWTLRLTMQAVQLGEWV